MRWTLALLGGLVAGCGDDGGSYETKGEAARAVMGAACDHAAECGSIMDSEIAECIDTLVGEVCDQIDCDARPVGSNADIDACLAAFADHGCSSGVMPAACNEII